MRYAEPVHMRFVVRMAAFTVFAPIRKYSIGRRMQYCKEETDAHLVPSLSQ
jgi:hypothetical protein